VTGELHILTIFVSVIFAVRGGRGGKRIRKPGAQKDEAGLSVFLE